MSFAPNADTIASQEFGITGRQKKIFARRKILIYQEKMINNKFKINDNNKYILNIIINLIIKKYFYNLEFLSKLSLFEESKNFYFGIRDIAEICFYQCTFVCACV